MPTQPPSPDELLRAVDPHTGLPFEDVDTPYPEDVRHWLSVYGELLQLKEAMLVRAREVLATATEPTRFEASVDLRLLRAQAERYQLRRSYWVARAVALLSSERPEMPDRRVS